MSEILEDHHLDIRNGEALKRMVLQTLPDFVFHLAAQPLVRQSYLDPVATYQTNTIGTLNLLEALRPLEKRCTTVLITSDKCYNNVEWVWGYRETDELEGPFLIIQILDIHLFWEVIYYIGHIVIRIIYIMLNRRCL